MKLTESFTFKLSTELLDQFRDKCKLVGMSTVMRMLIQAFVDDKITIDDLSD